MAWTIGKIVGIPVRLHFTMVLVPFLTYSWIPTSNLMGLVVWAVLVVCLFGSILLHELGHALTARRFGIHTQDIVLTPIGGMARVLSMPTNPKQEIAIAIAGPLVSLTLSGIVFVALFPLTFVPFLPKVAYEGALLLFWINLMLALFNLVPALPMDGGRVLRGVLALKRDHLSATIIAAKVGRILAVVGGLYALLQGNFSLGLISIFIYIAAGSEVRMAQMRAYQERMKDTPFAGASAGFPFPPPFDSNNGRVWVRSWSSQSPLEDTPDPTNHPTQTGHTPKEDWSDGQAHTDRDVVVIGGKAKIISRKDPEKKE